MIVTGYDLVRISQHPSMEEISLTLSKIAITYYFKMLEFPKYGFPPFCKSVAFMNQIMLKVSNTTQIQSSDAASHLYELMPLGTNIIARLLRHLTKNKG